MATRTSVGRAGTDRPLRPSAESSADLEALLAVAARIDLDDDGALEDLRRQAMKVTKRLAEAGRIPGHLVVAPDDQAVVVVRTIAAVSRLAAARCPSRSKRPRSPLPVVTDPTTSRPGEFISKVPPVTNARLSMEPSTSVRALFFVCAGHAADLITDGAVAAKWDEPSALAGYTVGGLCGHLSRAVFTVSDYIDRTPPDGVTSPSDAARYFAVVLGRDDPGDSELHASIRQRAKRAASVGPRALATSMRATLGQLRVDLDDAALARVVEARDGITLTVEDFLRTRLVELVIHVDDLAVSIGKVGPPALPDAGYIEVAGVLGRLAAQRMGGQAVVRSLARRERHEEAVRAL